jgi:transcriptional regulator with XRE-family HTH domain
MPKTDHVARALPPVATAALRQLGENLAIARKRRKVSQRSWAQRIGISLPTLIRMEQGEPTVSMGVYASALWLMGRVQALPEIAAPASDLGALEQAIRVAKSRAVRSPESIARRLKAGKPDRAAS